MHRTLGQAEIDRRRETLSALVSPGTTVAVEPLEEGPPAVESLADIAVVAAELVREVPRWRAGHYDAVVIGCFSDPGLAALRDLIEIPVVGPGASSVHVAAQFGDRFGVLSSEPTPKGCTRASARWVSATCSCRSASSAARSSTCRVAATKFWAASSRRRRPASRMAPTCSSSAASAWVLCRADRPAAARRPRSRRQPGGRRTQDRRSRRQPRAAIRRRLRKETGGKYHAVSRPKPASGSHRCA